MRILQLVKHYPPYFGGIETVVFDITEGINQMGIQCDVLCVNDRYKQSFENDKQYTVYRVPLIKKLFSTSLAPGLIWKLRKIIREYDILHVHFPDPMSALAIYFARPKCKIIVHWHSDIIKQKTILKFYKPLQDWVLKKANIIVGTSPTYISYSPSLIEFANKTICIPIGINPDSMKADNSLVEKLRRTYSGKNIVFSLGRHVYYKGFKYLIDAAKYLNDDTVVIIGGAGALYQELKEYIVSERLTHKVKLIGKINNEEIGSYFKACDVFCLPSIERSEAFGVVLLEAMLWGKPIVATNIPGSGVNWVNQNEVTGINVPIKNAEEISNAILKILSDQEFYDRLSKNAVLRFQQFFNNRMMIEQFAKIYRSLR